jgi:protein-S-isoprenylcysteine O-methyltransferase Ste14
MRTRAALAFLALPGFFAGVVPWVLASGDPWRVRGVQSGVVLVAIGLFAVLWCVRDFSVSGRGTLAPWAPPRHLVVVGLYRFTRNPMYIGVLAVAAGWGLTAGSPLVGLYLLLLDIGFHLRIVRYEEPRLAARFGSEWERYRSSVPRWFPRGSPW